MINGFSVSSHPKKLYCIYSGITSTSQGIIIVESKIINNKFLPGNSNRANPYAVRALENVMPTTARNVTIKELIRYLVKGCAVLSGKSWEGMQKFRPATSEPSPVPRKMEIRISETNKSE